MWDNLSNEDFFNLLNYYIDCIHKEELKSLNFNYKGDGKYFYSTVFNEEPFFFTGREQITLKKEGGIKAIIEEYEIARKNQPIFYGYPLYINPSGVVSPIFYFEIFLDKGQTEVTLTKESIFPEFNHYIFLNKDLSIEEIENIRTEIEEKDSFFEKIEKVLSLIGIEKNNLYPSYTSCVFCGNHFKNKEKDFLKAGDYCPFCNKQLPYTLDKNPILPTQSPKVLNKAIVYFGAKTGYTAGLLQELEKLKNITSNNYNNNSLNLIIKGNELEAKSSIKHPVLELFKLNESQEKALISSLSNPITVITGPPGTGKSQVVLNIIGNAIYNGQKVLFASKNNKAVDVVSDKLKSVFSENFIVRMGGQSYRQNTVVEMSSILRKKESLKSTENLQEYLKRINVLEGDAEKIKYKIKDLSDINRRIEIIYKEIDLLTQGVPEGLNREYQHDKYAYLSDLDIDSDLKQSNNLYFSLEKAERSIESNLSKLDNLRVKCITPEYILKSDIPLDEIDERLAEEDINSSKIQIEKIKEFEDALSTITDEIKELVEKTTLPLKVTNESAKYNLNLFEEKRLLGDIEFLNKVKDYYSVLRLLDSALNIKTNQVQNDLEIVRSIIKEKMELLSSIEENHNILSNIATTNNISGKYMDLSSKTNFDAISPIEVKRDISIINSKLSIKDKIYSAISRNYLVDRQYAIMKKYLDRLNPKFRAYVEKTIQFDNNGITEFLKMLLIFKNFSNIQMELGEQNKRFSAITEQEGNISRKYFKAKDEIKPLEIKSNLEVFLIFKKNYDVLEEELRSKIIDKNSLNPSELIKLLENLILLKNISSLKKEEALNTKELEGLINKIDVIRSKYFKESKKSTIEILPSNMAYLLFQKRESDLNKILKELNQGKNNLLNEEKEIFEKYYSKLSNDCKNYVNKNILPEKNRSKILLEILITQKKINELFKDIDNKNSILLQEPSIYDLENSIDEIKERKIKLSREIVENHWINKLKNITSPEEVTVERYIDALEKLQRGYLNTPLWRELVETQKSCMPKVLEYFPAWVVTNLSAKNSLPLVSNLFDLLVIDEASQCDIASVLPLLYRAKRVVIIGDPKQLRHISILKEQEDKKLAGKNKIEKLYVDYSYSKNSLYDLGERIVKSNNQNPILLDEHYRSHEDIISFSNQYFYENNLKIKTNPSNFIESEVTPPGVLWIDVKGKVIYPGNSCYNSEEIKEIAHVLKKLKDNNMKNCSFGVVTFFREQKERIFDKINSSKELKEINVSVGTAHTFQGDERDIMILSPVVSQGVSDRTLNWIKSTTQLLNVAVTRGRSSLIVVGDREKCISSGGILKNFVEYVDSNKYKELQFDSPVEEKLYKELKRAGIKVIPQFWTKVMGDKSYRLDFAMFVNGKKFDIEVDGDMAHSSMVDYDVLRDIHMRMDNWCIRRFKAREINNNLQSVVEEIKRLC